MSILLVKEENIQFKYVYIIFYITFFLTKLKNFFFLGRLVSDGLMEPYFGLQVIMVKCWRHLNVQISCRIQNR